MAAALRQSWLDIVSSVATGLCWVNCTVLPPVLAALPLAGFLSQENLHALHHVVHLGTLYFVVPVAGLSLATSYPKHQRADITAAGTVGALLLAAAHGPFGLHLVPHEHMSAATTVGSLALLGSQWYGRKFAAEKAAAAGTKACCAHKAAKGTSATAAATAAGDCAEAGDSNASHTVRMR